MADNIDHAQAAGGAVRQPRAGYSAPAIESRLPVHDPLLGNITASSGGGGG